MVYPKKMVSESAFQDDVDQRIAWCISVAKSMGYVKIGDTIIAVQGWRGGCGYTNTISK